MSRGFKINRQLGLEERDSNFAPWLKQFAAKQKDKPLTVVEQTRLRDAQSLVSQINNVMHNKSRYATVTDAVNDMKERTGLGEYINKITANDKQTIKIAEANVVDDFEQYMRDTDFDVSNSYFELGLADGEDDSLNDMVGDLLSSIRLRNISPHLTNFMNFGLGYIIGAKMSKDQGNAELKKVYEFIKKNEKLASADLKKKVNKLANEEFEDYDDFGGMDNFNYYMSEELLVDENSPAYRMGFEDGEEDADRNQVGDILSSGNARNDTSGDLGYSLDRFMHYGLGYCYGAKLSSESGKKELRRIFDYFRNRKTAQLSTNKSNKLPECLAKYRNAAEDIENFIRNNIKNTNALGASVPAVQHDLLSVFGQKYGIETRDVMNEDVARFINDIIVSEMAMLGPEEHNPHIGINIGKDLGDMSDNSDAFKGLMPAK